MDHKDFPEALKEKAKACTSVDELLELVRAEGVELSDEELGSLSGGTVLWGECPDDKYTPQFIPTRGCIRPKAAQKTAPDGLRFRTKAGPRDGFSFTQPWA